MEHIKADITIVDENCIRLNGVDYLSEPCVKKLMNTISNSYEKRINELKWQRKLRKMKRFF